MMWFIVFITIMSDTEERWTALPSVSPTYITTRCSTGFVLISGCGMKIWLVYSHNRRAWLYGELAIMALVHFTYYAYVFVMALW